MSEQAELGYVDWRGDHIRLSPGGREGAPPMAEQVLSDPGLPWNIRHLVFRDPKNFVAGQLCANFTSWGPLLKGQDGSTKLVEKCLREGVEVKDFFTHFKGNFMGRCYDSDSPPGAYFPNPPSIERHAEFVARTLEDRLRSGSLELLGRVGEVQPPYIVMPLTVEPSKPRLCHDERYLNLWVRDNPFSLETLRDVPTMVGPGDYIATCDEKSAYDGILLGEGSRMYFGLQFAGWWMTYKTLPFGWKASPFLYQTVGLRVTSYLRDRGVPLLQYIDDRLIGPWCGGSGLVGLSGCKRTELSVYATCELAHRLGYTLALGKSMLDPAQRVQFLGMLVDSKEQRFMIPEDKRERFKQLRESILQAKLVPVSMVQSLMGKCVFFSICVPAAKLFIRDMALATSRASKNSKGILVGGALRQEVEHWRFLDGFQESVPWRKESHKVITLATDSSTFKWGAVLDGREVGDFWDREDNRPIHIKEAEALLCALQAFRGDLQHHRVDARVDNMAVVHSWNGEGSRSPELNMVLKKIFQVTRELNIELKTSYINTKVNPADKPSRRLTGDDTMISPVLWQMVESYFGPHTFDLMSLDSNCMRDREGHPLPHYSPFPLPGSVGVNMFAQILNSRENYYVFPPYCMVAPTIRFLLSHEGPLRCSLIVPRKDPLPLWWPVARQGSSAMVKLVDRGATWATLEPSRLGFNTPGVGLAHELWLVRVCK